MNKRIIKSISFNCEDPYEMDLHEFAIKQGKYFGKYIKRLIDRDKREQKAGVGSVQGPSSSPDVIKLEGDKDSDAASAFL